VGASLALTVAPALADTVSQTMGIDAWAGRLALSVGLVSVAIPTHRFMNNRIDRAFFPVRHIFKDQVLKLMDELPQLDTPTDVVMRASTRIDELLRPESCASYLRASEGYANIFARGRGVPPVFDDRNPLIAALEARETPLVADRWSRAQKHGELSAFDRAALESLDAAVIVPIRRSTELLGFACLGPKRSGDLYTATDLTLLGSLGNRIAAELVRFDADELVRQAEEMQAALRSYVPGAVAAELEKGKEIRPTECEVSVLFVDIRGYTALSQQRPAEEVFSMVSRYTEAVSDVIRRYAGSVVEFHGDGLMAVFGAPNELAAKEQAAVEAGCTIMDVMASIHLTKGWPSSSPISVGIGVATGRAFVGNIRAVDRWIWSAIGNTTNRAARLESLTRDLGAAMVVDEATQARAVETCEHFEKREGITIRGYSEPTDLYVLPLGQQ
jgi:class 3 adenylate cyclase